MRQWVGLGLLLVAVLAIAGYELISRATAGSQTPVATVSGYAGGEKLGFLADPQVQRILRDRYHLKVNATKAGSIEMVQGSTAGQDFLWPSSQVALDLFQQRHGTVKSATTFNSPIVLYAWAPVANALERHGFIKTSGGVSYFEDFPRFARMVIAGKQWSALGLQQLYGPITLFTTDPNKSSSGLMFAGLLGNGLNGYRVVDSAALPRVLPQIKQFYDRLGYLEGSSADLFDQFLKSGIGAKPIIAAYENQLVEYSIQNPSYAGLIKKNIRVIYPRPTVLSEHAFIALDGKGQRLLNALNDRDIQQLAWTQHGFRSGVVGTQNNPKDLRVIGVPNTVPAIVPMPRFTVMQRMLHTLGQS